MIVAIPLDENKKDVCVSFARAPFFMFYDLEKDTQNIVLNDGADVESGAGPKTAQFLLDSNIDALITVRCGENAGDVLKEAQVKIYKSLVKDAKENIEKFKNNELEILDKFHAGFHGIL